MNYFSACWLNMELKKRQTWCPSSVLATLVCLVDVYRKSSSCDRTRFYIARSVNEPAVICFLIMQVIRVKHLQFCSSEAPCINAYLRMIIKVALLPSRGFPPQHELRLRHLYTTVRMINEATLGVCIVDLCAMKCSHKPGGTVVFLLILYRNVSLAALIQILSR